MLVSVCVCTYMYVCVFVCTCVCLYVRVCVVVVYRGEEKHREETGMSKNHKFEDSASIACEAH